MQSESTGDSGGFHLHATQVQRQHTGYTFLQGIHVRGDGSNDQVAVQAEQNTAEPPGFRHSGARVMANWKVLEFAGSGFSTRDSGLEGENKIHTVKFISTEVELLSK